MKKENKKSKLKIQIIIVSFLIAISIFFGAINIYNAKTAYNMDTQNACDIYGASLERNECKRDMGNLSATAGGTSLICGYICLSTVFIILSALLINKVK